MIEDIRANLRIVDNRLVPSAFDPTEGRNTPPPIDTTLVSILVGTDRESRDVLRDWGPDAPEDWEGLRLSARERRRMQRRRLFLRNRRVVCGYELLDRDLRSKIGGGDPESAPPTWLTVGKWTALGIGDLLEGRLALPTRDRRIRRAVRLAVSALSRWRAIPMGRILVMGNREIFAQVASVLTIFVRLDFNDRHDDDFLDFVRSYGEQLLGRFNKATADELLFPIRATVRDPLSDSLLRALHCYYRAIGAADQADREIWVLAGNLHLAAYEQHIAQTFVDLALSLRPERALKGLLHSLGKRRSESGDLNAKVRPLDMVLEGSLLSRLFDLVTAAFATRFILAIGVGRRGAGTTAADREPVMVFAPGLPLERVGNEPIAATRAAGTEATASLEGVWFALDRVQGEPGRSLVRDWRNYPSRISYISNLFAIADHYSSFRDPVFAESELLNFLRGSLPADDGVRLTAKQLAAARQLLDTPARPAGVVEAS